MKKPTRATVENFTSRSLDVSLIRGLSAAAESKKSTDLLSRLSEDAAFREAYCEWLRGLRDPQHLNARQADRKAS